MKRNDSFGRHATWRSLAACKLQRLECSFDTCSVKCFEHCKNRDYVTTCRRRHIAIERPTTNVEERETFSFDTVRTPVDTFAPPLAPMHTGTQTAQFVSVVAYPCGKAMVVVFWGDPCASFG